ncbi:MAG: OmpA family protein [Prolixibacteraceae bacterium]|nr:OmpA family protein [Prolixibacteraceae bacterium]
MKKVLLLSLIVAFALTVNAQTVDKKWGIAAGVGGYGSLNDGGLGLMPELYLSRYLSPKLDLMLKGDLGVFNSKLNSNLDLANAFLNLRYKLTDESKKFRPYLFAGPGFLADNSETGLNFDLGLGGKYYFNPNTALYLDAGYINGIETTVASKTVRDNFWKATLGIEYDFGKTADSDMDGVSDKKDKCPNTPTGVAVDENGCPIDSDGDGVADYIDDCPTVAGLTSLKGCPDTDKDGIADKDDACPEVAGVASLKGCPDADGDGVTDANDKCPGTKKGYKVDATGCPLDTDKDGVVDEEDECPTVAGLKENKGCPKKELTAEELEAQKMKVEPVYFDSNKTTFTADEKVKVDKLVNLLKENEDYKVNITGHADSQGEDNYNMNLSKIRANAVVKAITSSKVKKNRIASQKGLGETTPAATNDTPEGRALNRRVEFEVIKTK